MGRNLTNLYISQSFEYLVQLSGSELQNGLGSTLTGSLLITASKADTATSASFATTATSASFATTSTSASFASTATSASFASTATSASQATSASFAITASYAMNAGTTVSTASLLTTASATANVITFTKGDGSTFPVTIATGSAVSASFATTASLALNNVLTSSTNNDTITFTKGDGTTYTNVINNVSASISASRATSAASADTATTASYVLNAVSASYALSASQAQNAVSASYALSASQAANATTASFALNITGGLSPNFNNVTASNVLITGTASVALLHTTTISSSVIFSSGSNLLGDSATLDTQTLIGIVKTSGSFSATGSAEFTGGDFKVTDQARNAEFDVDFFKVKTQSGTQFTGSVSSQNGFTGSLAGTASYANNALSSSYAVSASQAQNAVSASVAVSSSFATTASFALTTNTGSLLTTASAAGNVVTFTKGDGSTFPVTVATGSAAAAFPFTGSAAISGTIDFNGKSTQTQNIIRFGGDKGFYADATGSIVIGFDSYNTSSGRHNIVIGSASLQNATTAADNVLIGYRTGQLLTTGRQNVIIGTEGDGNWTGDNLTTGNNNVFIGQGVATNSSNNAANNVLIGYHTGLQGTQGASNVGLGAGVFREGVGAQNVALGDGPMYGATNANRNIAFGNYTAFDITGDQNIFIGDRVHGIGTGQWTGDRYLAIGSETHATGSLLYGYHGTAIPKFLTINGDLRVTSSIIEEGSSTSANPGMILASGSGRPLYFYAGGGINPTFDVEANQAIHHFVAGGTQTYTSLGLNNAWYFGYGFGGTPTAEFNANNYSKFYYGLHVTGGLQVSGAVVGNVVGNNTDTYTSSAAVQQVVTLTQAEYNAIGSPNANTLYIISGSAPFNSAAFATTGSNTFIGNQTISGSLIVTGSALFTNIATFNNAVFSGSVRGVVISGSITSNTSSLDFSTANFFSLNTANVLNTHIVPTNVQSGQTVNLELTFPATASAITFPSYVKQPSGSAYTPSGANTTDILTFIVFNSGSVYLSNVKNMI